MQKFYYHIYFNSFNSNLNKTWQMINQVPLDGLHVEIFWESSGPDLLYVSLKSVETCISCRKVVITLIQKNCYWSCEYMWDCQS